MNFLWKPTNPLTVSQLLLATQKLVENFHRRTEEMLGGTPGKPTPIEVRNFLVSSGGVTREALASVTAPDLEGTVPRLLAREIAALLQRGHFLHQEQLTNAGFFLPDMCPLIPSDKVSIQHKKEGSAHILSLGVGGEELSLKYETTGTRPLSVQFWTSQDTSVRLRIAQPSIVDSHIELYPLDEADWVRVHEFQPTDFVSTGDLRGPFELDAFFCDEEGNMAPQRLEWNGAYSEENGFSPISSFSAVTPSKTYRFTYTALDGQGQEVKGTVDAASQEEAIKKVREIGYFPTQTKGKKTST